MSTEPKPTSHLSFPTIQTRKKRHHTKQKTDNTAIWFQPRPGRSKSCLWQVLAENKDLHEKCTFRASSPLLPSSRGAIIANPLFAQLTTVRWMGRTSFVLQLLFLLPPDWGNRALLSATFLWFQWMKHRFGLDSASLLCWWQLFYTQGQLRDSSCFFDKFKNLLLLLRLLIQTFVNPLCLLICRHTVIITRNKWRSLIVSILRPTW